MILLINNTEALKVSKGFSALCGIKDIFEQIMNDKYWSLTNEPCPSLKVCTDILRFKKAQIFFLVKIK
jgi:hypothetical protein